VFFLKCQKKKVEYYLSNTIINNNVLKACLENGVKRVCSTTSTVMFPQFIDFPVDEKDIFKGDPNEMVEGYSWSKRMLQILSKMISSQNEGFIYTTCVVSNIYGIESNFSLSSGQVVSSLIHKCYIAKEKNEDFICMGTGNPKRQFIYVDDLAELLLWAVNKYDDYKEPLILTCPEEEEISIKGLCEIIMKVMEYNKELKYDLTVKDGAFQRTTSTKKLQNYLPDFKFTPFEIGLNTTIKWFIENYDNIKK